MTHKATDETLISMFLKDKSRDAIDLLCRRYWNEVNHFIEWKYMITSDKSQDLTQDIFILVESKIKEHYIEQGQFRSWLYRIVHNFMSDYFRKAKRAIPQESLDVESFQLPDYSDSFAAEKKERVLEQMLQHMNETVNALPPEKKGLIDLKYREQKTFQEIADMYRLKKSTCVKRIRVICQKMREEMVRSGFTEMPD